MGKQHYQSTFSAITLVLLAVLSLVYAATGEALFLAHIFTGLVEPRLLRAVTVVFNHRTSFILDYHALDSIRLAMFGHSLSILNLWSRPWGVSLLMRLRGVDPPYHPQEWVE